MFIQKNTASKFRAAPRMKNKVVDPVQSNKYGKRRAVIKAPMFPAMFIVPDTAPAFSLPISTQNAQEGGRVISAPKIAMLRQIMAPTAESM